MVSEDKGPGSTEPDKLEGSGTQVGTKELDQMSKVATIRHVQWSGTRGEKEAGLLAPWSPGRIKILVVVANGRR